MGLFVVEEENPTMWTSFLTTAWCALASTFVGFFLGVAFEPSMDRHHELLLTYIEVKYEIAHPNERKTNGGLSKSMLTTKWLQEEYFLQSRTARFFADRVLEFLYMNEADRLDLRFSSYAQLRKEGIKCFEDEDIRLSDLINEVKSQRFHPCRFSKVEKRMGYLFVFAITSFLWLCLLVYPLQFKDYADNGDGLDVEDIWIDKVISGSLGDVVFFQPFTLLGTAILIYWWFISAMPENLVASDTIKTRKTMNEALVKLFEQDLKSQEALDTFNSGATIGLNDLAANSPKGRHKRHRGQGRGLNDLVNAESAVELPSM